MASAHLTKRMFFIKVIGILLCRLDASQAAPATRPNPRPKHPLQFAINIFLHYAVPPDMKAFDGGLVLPYDGALIVGRADSKSVALPVMTWQSDIVLWDNPAVFSLPAAADATPAGLKIPGPLVMPTRVGLDTYSFEGFSSDQIEFVEPISYAQAIMDPTVTWFIDRKELKYAISRAWVPKDSVALFACQQRLLEDDDGHATPIVLDADVLFLQFRTLLGKQPEGCYRVRKLDATFPDQKAAPRYQDLPVSWNSGGF